MNRVYPYLALLVLVVVASVLVTNCPKPKDRVGYEPVVPTDLAWVKRTREALRKQDSTALVTSLNNDLVALRQKMKGLEAVYAALKSQQARSRQPPQPQKQTAPSTRIIAPDTTVFHAADTTELRELATLVSTLESMVSLLRQENSILVAQRDSLAGLLVTERIKRKVETDSLSTRLWVTEVRVDELEKELNATLTKLRRNRRLLGLSLGTNAYQYFFPRK